ncbi:MAG: UDP-galactopyranose/dTDP-fucopyranose mutase family protein [Chthoniobacterales bacterium]
MPASVDCLIVGAGFSGLTVAERLTTQQGKTCLVVEKRDHLGGNAYDKYDEAGVLIHNYGPHYFRTNAPRIVDYLSQFTEWHPVDYQILSYSDGRYWNFPINLNTFEQFLGRPSTSEEMEAWLAEKRVPIESPANSEEVIVSQVGWELYEKFFKGYTLKQWRRHPKDLDASVCGRIPIRTNRDDRYLREEFQAIPKDGYTAMFERMVAACGDKLEIRLNTEFRDILPQVEFRHLVYTGPIDEYYDFCHGRLPYRSLRFEPESFTPAQLSDLRPPTSDVPVPSGFYQPAMQVNYPNDEKFTRIVEIKHATGQQCENTTIVREYPDDFGPGKEAYYPIPAPDSAALYQKYKSLTETDPFPAHLRALATRRPSPVTTTPSVSFIGRLATYRYYNMDQVVGMALKESEKIASLG